MACDDEKQSAILAGAAVTVTGTGLIFSTATGPGFAAVAAGFILACANYGRALGKWGICLEANGQSGAARELLAKADQINQEIDKFIAWAKSKGIDLSF